MVTCAVNAAQNIEKCVEARTVGQRRRPGTISVQLFVLSPDERDLGVCLVDIGGGT